MTTRSFTLLALSAVMVLASSTVRAAETCAMWPIQYMGNNEYLYYAEFYEICNGPVPAYLQGSFSWPESCAGACIFHGYSGFSSAPPTRFEGLKSTVDPYHDFRHTCPVRIARRILQTPPIPKYSDIVNLKGKDRRFVCFQFTILEPGTTTPRTVSFGKEVSSLPTPDTMTYPLTFPNNAMEPTADGPIDSLGTKSATATFAFRGVIDGSAVVVFLARP